MKHPGAYWAAVVLTMFLGSLVRAQHVSVESFQIEPQSRLWLNGSSTVGGFTCGTRIAKEFTLTAGHAEGRAADSIAVRKLDCGNGAMNRDMYAAMKADSFPAIKYEFVSAKELPDSVSVNGSRALKTEGRLTIAGVTRPEEIAVRLRQVAPNQFHLEGRKELSMFDFGVTPPTAFLGLIKSNNRLVVNFDIVASRMPAESLGSRSGGSAFERGLKANPKTE